MIYLPSPMWFFS